LKTQALRFLFDFVGSDTGVEDREGSGDGSSRRSWNWTLSSKESAEETVGEVGIKGADSWLDSSFIEGLEVVRPKESLDWLVGRLRALRPLN
jgi:hypothetical protein